jgi:hypothetical protein
MSPEEFSQIEACLELKLPEDYVHRLTEYPLTESEEDLFNTAEEVIQENERLRTEGYFGSPWPREFFVIGQSSAGDPFFILPDSNDHRVFCADHETGPKPDVTHLSEMEFCDTLAEYIDLTKETLAELAQETERQKTKKWWQFWL